MKPIQTLALVLGLATPAVATAAPKTYQVTGPVLEVTDSAIVVQKGKEKWQIDKDATTKGAADVKVGDKVTIEYKMTATSVEVKGAGKAAAAADKAAAGAGKAADSAAAGAHKGAAGAGKAADNAGAGVGKAAAKGKKAADKAAAPAAP